MKTLHIGIGFDSYRPWNRRVLHGVTRYSKEQTDWHLVLLGLTTRQLPFFAELAGRVDGWIVDRPNPDLPKPIPQIAITPQAGDRPRAAVVSDMKRIGALGAEALFKSGYHRVACLEIEAGLYDPDDDRHAGFIQRAAELGLDLRFLSSPLINRKSSVSAKLSDQLRQLEKPVGLFAHNLNEAHVLSFFVLEAGLEVPHEVGLLVGGDDQTGLEALIPSISGIDRNMEQIGWQAARQLDRRLRGETVESIIRIPPLGVVYRQSTQLDRSDDPIIRKAQAFIREHLESPLAIEQIARVAHVSASSLHRRFRKILGHTPAEEIRRQRMRCALQLLRETNLPLSEVSSRCGYAESSQLSRAVKAETAMTPRDFRLATR